MVQIATSEIYQGVVFSIEDQPSEVDDSESTSKDIQIRDEVKSHFQNRISLNTYTIPNSQLGFSNFKSNIVVFFYQNQVSIIYYDKPSFADFKSLAEDIQKYIQNNYDINPIMTKMSELNVFDLKETIPSYEKPGIGCIETDDGVNYLEKGTIREKYESETVSRESDECALAPSLKRVSECQGFQCFIVEYECTSNNPINWHQDAQACGPSGGCKDGACVNMEVETSDFNDLKGAIETINNPSYKGALLFVTGTGQNPKDLIASINIMKILKTGKIEIGSTITDEDIEEQIVDASGKNLVIIGGPCANKIWTKYSDLTCESWPYKPNQGIIKAIYTGTNIVFLAAGTTAEDTEKISLKLSNYLNDPEFSNKKEIIFNFD
jgi:hypothetical protein